MRAVVIQSIVVDSLRIGLSLLSFKTSLGHCIRPQDVDVNTNN